VSGETKIDKAIDDQLARTSSGAFIAAAASPGATYNQAEMVAVRNVANACRQILIDAGLMPAS
jgi:N-acetylglucosamine kinase-like BadF-type ATPase